MQIELINLKNLPYYPKNGVRSEAGSFVGQITPLVEFMFNGDTEKHPMGYVLSTNTNRIINRFKSLVRTEGDITIETAWDDKYRGEPTNFTDTENLGPMERGVLNFISVNTGSLIVLRGFRGTGKSELLHFIAKFMLRNKKHHNCEHSLKCPRKNISNIFLDFNSFSFTAFKRDLYRELFKKIGYELKFLFNRELLANFLQDCKIPIIDSFKENHKTIFQNIEVDLIRKKKDWDTFDYDTQYQNIYTWIEKKDIKTSFEAILGMLYFYTSKYPSRNCTTIFIDNIDKLEDKHQAEAIGIIKEVNEKAGVQVVMTTRLTTFRNGIGNASLSYCVLEHYGHSPLEICLKRIEHYLNNKTTLQYYRNVRFSIQQKYPEYLEAFEKRLEYIYIGLTSKTDNKFTRLKRTLDALPGVSIRKSIKLFRRLFYNYVIRWQDTEPTEDMLIRSLYSYHYKDGKMDINDRRIHNIFCEPATQNLTLSSLRILHIMQQCEKKGIRVTKQDIEDTICHIFNQKTSGDLLEQLWKSGKRVIIYSFFDQKDKKKNKEATLEMTKSGYLYLRYLCSDLQYIQSCFEIIDKKFDIQGIDEVLAYIKIATKDKTNCYAEKVLEQTIQDVQKNGTESLYPPKPINYNEKYKRFEYIRSILKVIFYKDIIETISYKKQFNTTKKELKRIAKIDNMVTVPIITGVTSSIIKISKSKTKDECLKIEMEEWYNFILLVKELNTVFFPKSDYKEGLESISNKLFKLISNEF
jgi:hypothetical protein